MKAEGNGCSISLDYAGSRNSNNTTYQVWKQDYYAVQTDNQKMLPQRRAYIHNNPVRAGIADNPEDYVYSSARLYYGKKCLIELAAI